MERRAKWVAGAAAVGALAAGAFVTHSWLSSAPQPTTRTRITIEEDQRTKHEKVRVISELAAAAGGPDFPYVGDTYGSQKTLVVRVNLTDLKVQTPESAIQPVMASVSNYYAMASYGAIKSFPTTVVSVELPVDSTTFCGYVWNYSVQIENLVAQQGITPSEFPRLIFVHPVVPTGCFWCGNASVGDPDQSVTWIRDDCVNAQVFAHELGHNFGLWHAHSQVCDPATPEYPAYCYSGRNQEYGDGFDPMGHGDLSHPFAVFAKRRLGWADYRGYPDTQTITASGVYRLADSLPRRGEPKALFYHSNHSPNYFGWWIEYRSGVGLTIRTGGGGCFLAPPACHGNTDDQTLMDLDPDTPLDYVLDSGQTFTHPDITVSALDPTTVQVTVP